jgi:hypothetical protein
MNATDIAAKFGDARRQSRAGTSEIAAEAKKLPPAHPFNAVIDMIVRSASSYLRDKGETTAIRHAAQGSSPRDSSPAYRTNEHARPARRRPAARVHIPDGDRRR